MVQFYTNCLYYGRLEINGVRKVEIEFNHVPVMLEECINNLNINPDGIYIDGTMRRSWA